ncbi:MAG: hypothetical protein ACKPJJ_33750, partial [Planctomycetaceae bacterium]
RLYVQRLDDPQQPWFFATSVNPQGAAVPYNKQVAGTASVERNVALSADPFQVQLPPGRYRATAMRGKEYLPAIQEFSVPADQPVDLQLKLQRYVRMSEQGWYSGDVHLHRPMAEVPA